MHCNTSSSPSCPFLPSLGITCVQNSVWNFSPLKNTSHLSQGNSGQRLSLYEEKEGLWNSGTGFPWDSLIFFSRNTEGEIGSYIAYHRQHPRLKTWLLSNSNGVHIYQRKYSYHSCKIWSLEGMFSGPCFGYRRVWLLTIKDGNLQINITSWPPVDLNLA